MKKLAILGSTGSIGKSALSLVDLYPDRFEVLTLAAGSQGEQLYEQVLRYRPRTVALFDPVAARNLRTQLPGVRVLSGVQGVIEAAAHPDVDAVVAGISGAAGLLPTYHAVREGKLVALANKETLVMAGEIIMGMVEDGGGSLLPVDSEHSALHQCLRGAHPSDVKRLLLTASGGPFFKKSAAELETVTVEEALRHPTWDMGPKITIDSATLMNKGLEVIEAHHLFGVGSDQITVVVHPQSVVHSMVEFLDGNILAQMGITDMRSAILYALSYPERWESNLPRLGLSELGSLTFHPPDIRKFPCLRLAYSALEAGGTFPAVLNAANEIAVGAFLNDGLPFQSIPEVIEVALQNHKPVDASDLETILEVDRETRSRVSEILTSRQA